MKQAGEQGRQGRHVRCESPGPRGVRPRLVGPWTPAGMPGGRVVSLRVHTQDRPASNHTHTAHLASLTWHTLVGQGQGWGGGGGPGWGLGGSQPPVGIHFFLFFSIQLQLNRPPNPQPPFTTPLECQPPLAPS